ncbi:hypothetical protein [Polaribacter gangjinensis]|uniref:Uncharacterized protein n=1 Tax=Polaribacter gangjinensis TaxID=574710 RepID=A0A2S7WDZ6_9FLAO|nr:hypothetical protein [Polaribacter gangjinensis]PQJ75823.1 hypothetical protein BTO13_11585 [Polaribacter gangjinensis]
MKKIIILFIIFSSCKKEVYYYPSKKFFDENKTTEISIDNLNFKQITDSIRNELYNKRNLYIKVIEFNKTYIISPFANTGGYIRERNMLKIINDSIFRMDKTYHISHLSKFLKLHYENNNKEIDLPFSYKRAFIELSLEPNADSKKLKNYLLKILETYNKTEIVSKDSIELGIMLDYPLDRIFPNPPPPIPIEIEE